MEHRLYVRIHKSIHNGLCLLFQILMRMQIRESARQKKDHAKLALDCLSKLRGHLSFTASRRICDPNQGRLEFAEELQNPQNSKIE